jgi:hypothetical protein
MAAKELKKADWFEQQELDEREHGEGYHRYFTGDPVEEDEHPSPAYIAGYLQARADRDAEKTLQRASVKF